jgi:hypothetical protein
MAGFGLREDQLPTSTMEREIEMEDASRIIDDRDEANPDFEVQKELSCTNTGFGGKDPASEPGFEAEVGSTRYEA